MNNRDVRLPVPFQDRHVTAAEAKFLLIADALWAALWLLATY